ncbi:porin (plasmid) [Acinetobacter sp. NCu2D-2]|nr:porin [Acinetobacter sp. NCu2D-2]
MFYAGVSYAGVEINTPDFNFRISGMIDTGIASVTNVKEGAHTQTEAVDSILGVSNIGLSGQYKFDQNYQAFFNLQSGFKPSTGEQNKDGELFDRNAYAGLKTPYGAISIGKQWSLNDDWFVGSVFKGGYNSGAIFKLSEFDAVSELYSKTFKYVSPEMTGWQFGAFYATEDSSAKNTHGQIFSGALKYTTDRALIGASYEDHAAQDTSNHYRLTTLASQYKYENLTTRLGLVFSNITGPGQYAAIASNLAPQNAWASEIGVDYAFTPKFTLSGDILYKKNTTFDSNTIIYRSLAAYQLFKPLSLIANIAYLKNEDGSTESLVNTDSPFQGGGYVNQDQLSTALGIRFSF